MNVMTVIPEVLRADGNHLAAAVGLTMADMLTYDQAPRVTDADGNQYRWANAVVSETFFRHLSEPLVRPDFDTEAVIDMDAAQTLLANAVLFAEDTVLPPDQLVIAPNCDPQSVLAALGLTGVSDE